MKHIIFQLHIRHLIGLIFMTFFKRNRFFYMSASRRLTFLLSFKPIRWFINKIFIPYSSQHGCTGKVYYKHFSRVYHLVEKFWLDYNLEANCFIKAYKKFYHTEKIRNIAKLGLGWEAFILLKRVGEIQSNEIAGSTFFYVLDNPFYRYQ